MKDGYERFVLLPEIPMPSVAMEMGRHFCLFISALLFSFFNNGMVLILPSESWYQPLDELLKYVFLGIL